MSSEGQVLQGGEDQGRVPFPHRCRLDGVQSLVGLAQGHGHACVERRCPGSLDLTEVPVDLGEAAGAPHGYDCLAVGPDTSVILVAGATSESRSTDYVMTPAVRLPYIIVNPLRHTTVLGCEGDGHNVGGLRNGSEGGRSGPSDHEVVR